MRHPPLLVQVLCLFALAAVLGRPALADETVAYRASASGFEIVRGGRVVAAISLPGSPVHDLLRLGDTLYVARGVSGVAVFDVSDPSRPTQISVLQTRRAAVKLASAGSTLVVIVAEYGAVAYDVTDRLLPVSTRLEPVLAQLARPPLPGPAASRPASAPAVAPAQPALATPAPRARGPALVTGVRGGWVYLKGSLPLSRGDRFIIRSHRAVTRPDPVSGEPRQVPSRKNLGLVIVDQVHGTVGAGPLGRGARAEVGDLAEPTERGPERNPLFPRQWSGFTRLTMQLRPFLPVRELGLGMLTDFSLQHYFHFPLKVGVELAPLGFLAISGGTGFAGEVRGWLAFTHDYFEIGLAPGVELQRVDQTTRFLFAYAVRIGCLDGLNVEFQNSYLVLRENGKNQFAFQSALGEINIPVHPRFMLTLEAGGGRTFAYGAGGLKSYLRGGGGPGTIILRTSVGGAYLKDERPAQIGTPSLVIDGGGPAVSVGLDARF